MSGKHARETPWWAQLSDWILNQISPFVDGWRAYPPEWDDNGEYIGRHRK